MRSGLNNPVNTMDGRHNDGRLALLREGLVCEFMGRRWRLLAGEVVEDALREGWRDGGGPTDGEDAFIAWALEGGQLVEFLPAAMGMDSAVDEWWDRLHGAVEELVRQHQQKNDGGIHHAESCAEHPCF